MIWDFSTGTINNGTIISSTFWAGGLSRFLPINNETMVLSTFGAGGPRDFGTMEQWFYQLLGPGVPLICKQWNNGFINFWGRGSH